MRCPQRTASEVLPTPAVPVKTQTCADTCGLTSLESTLSIQARSATRLTNPRTSAGNCAGTAESRSMFSWLAVWKWTPPAMSLACTTSPALPDSSDRVGPDRSSFPEVLSAIIESPHVSPRLDYPLCQDPLAEND